MKKTRNLIAILFLGEAFDFELTLCRQKWQTIIAVGHSGLSPQNNNSLLIQLPKSTICFSVKGSGVVVFLPDADESFSAILFGIGNGRESSDLLTDRKFFQFCYCCFRSAGRSV